MIESCFFSTIGLVRGWDGDIENILHGYSAFHTSDCLKVLHSQWITSGQDSMTKVKQ